MFYLYSLCCCLVNRDKDNFEQYILAWAKFDATLV